MRKEGATSSRPLKGKGVRRLIFMKVVKNTRDKGDKQSMKAPKKDLTPPAVPVPTAATELSEEDLKKVTGGNLRHEMLKAVAQNLR